MTLSSLLNQYDEHTAAHNRQIAHIKGKMVGPVLELIARLQAGMSFRDIGAMIHKPGGGHYSGQYIWLLATKQKSPSAEFVRALLEALDGSDDAKPA